MAESVIVGIVVATVVLLAGRSLYRTLTGKTGGGGCGGGGCPLSGSCDLTTGVKVDQNERRNAYEQMCVNLTIDGEQADTSLR